MPALQVGMGSWDGKLGRLVTVLLLCAVLHCLMGGPP
jgi:hypothetical protein